MNGTDEDSKSGFVDGSRFVFDVPKRETPQAEEATRPMLTSQPSPDAFKPRPARPFPISSRDENPKRGNWWNKIEFILACVAVSISAFPFMSLSQMVLIHGGGIFLILFGLAMIFIAFPYLVLEMAVGQFSSSGFISLWNLSPLFKGFGVVATVYLALQNAFTGIFGALHLLYAYYTIQYSVSSETLPWLRCSNTWNTPSCYIPSHANESTVDQESVPMEYTPRVLASEEYAEYLFGVVPGHDLTYIGSLRPNVVFALLVTWGFILALSCMGAKWTGKVSYFIVPATVILLFALLMRGATLPGAIYGLTYYLHFSWSALLDFDTWIAALRLAFYAGLFGFGVFSSLASYNKFHNNLCLDAFFVVIAIVFVHVMILVIVATYTGFYSATNDVPMYVLGPSGWLSTTAALPLILGSVPTPNAWTCVFFITIFLLFISSCIYMVQALLTNILDLFRLPHSFVFLLPTSGIICVLSFLVSLPAVTQIGSGLLDILDMHTLRWPAFAVAITLPLVSVWVYGTIPRWDIMRLPREIQAMVGFFPRPVQFVFLVFWAGVIPASVAALAIFELYHMRFSSYVGPFWMEYIFFALGIVPVVLIAAVVGIVQLCKRTRGYVYFSRLFWTAAHSSEDWGPPAEYHRRQVGYSRTDNTNRQRTPNSYNTPTADPRLVTQNPTPTIYPQLTSYTPLPPYNDHQPISTSLSPAPSSVGSGSPSVYPPLDGGPSAPAAPPTISPTSTLNSNNRLYPSTEQEAPLVNVSSHETTL